MKKEISIASYRGENGKFGYCNALTGIPLTSPVYDRVYAFENPLAVVEKDGKRGLVDENGREAAPCIYDAIYNYTECGLAKAVREGKYGYLDGNGKECVPCEYTFLDDFMDGHALAAKDDRMFFIDRNGKMTNGL